MSDYYVVTFELWPVDKEETHTLGRHSETEVHQADSPTGAINDALYYIRGRKSNYEMARVENIVGPFATENRARTYMDDM